MLEYVGRFQGDQSGIKTKKKKQAYYAYCNILFVGIRVLVNLVNRCLSFNWFVYDMSHADRTLAYRNSGGLWSDQEQ